MPIPRLLTVEEVAPLTPRMLRVVLRGEDLAGFGAGEFTDHYVKLLLPPAGASYAPPFDPAEIKATLPREQWPRMRTYTVRAFDAERLRLTIDVVVHGDAGLAGPWAAAAAPGDRVQILGPGGAYAPDPDAPWHLFVGDPSVMPAIAASLEHIPAGVPALVLVEIDDDEDKLPLGSPGALDLRWVPREDGALLAAVRALDLPDGDGQCFVHGEASAVREVRKHLLVERGLDPARLSASGYWKRRRTDEEWRADKAEWVRQAELDTAGALPPA